MRKKDWLFLLLTAVVAATVLPSLIKLLRGGGPSEYYSHIPLVPAVSAYLIYRRRKEMFRGAFSMHPAGLILLAAGAIGYGLSIFLPVEVVDRVSIIGLAGLLCWWGAYLLFYGQGAGRREIFPVAFLLFAVPVPIPLIEKIIAALVTGSTFMTRILFEAFRVPFVQEGAIFYLPGFNIEVAQECSGIRSSLALLITAVLAGHIFLKRLSSKVLLALLIFPVAVFKNGIRIITLYLLSYFIDIRIIEGGFLHRSGGFIFFGLGLVATGVILLFLKGLEE